MIYSLLFSLIFKLSGTEINLTFEHKEKLIKQFEEINTELRSFRKNLDPPTAGKIWANRPKITFVRQFGIKS